MSEEYAIFVCNRDILGKPRGSRWAHTGRCAECNHPIYWGASAPNGPLKVCVQCGFDIAGVPMKDRPPEYRS